MEDINTTQKYIKSTLLSKYSEIKKIGLHKNK
jgi:hypothetical protein